MTPARPWIAAAVLAATAAVGLVGCASDAPAAAPTEGAAFDLDALAEAAQDEGSLTLYGDASEATMTAWTDAFTDEYGIDVFIVRNTPGPLYQQFSQELAAGQPQADIISIVDHASLDAGVENGWIAEYTPQDAGLYPAGQGRAGYYYPVANGNAQTIAYNADNLTDDEIDLIRNEGVAALADDAFRDRIGVVNPELSSGVQAFWYLYTDGAGDLGWDGVADIADNTGRIADTLTLGQNLIQGEIDIAVPMVDSYVSTQIIANGAPLEFVYASPTIGQTDGVAVVEGSPHPNAARLFMEWAATPEANSLYSELSQSAPSNSESEDTRQLLGEPWFTPAGDDTWFDFADDDSFLAAMQPDGPYFPKWDDTFGYSG